MSSNTINILYADCFSGISGDMFIGALIDAGLPMKHLKAELAKLPLQDYQLRTEINNKQCGLRATKLTVTSKEGQQHRTWTDIEKLIYTSDLTDLVKKQSLAIFQTLARAEAHVHACKVEDVHFHEVGAIDSIVDIVGAAIGLAFFKIDQITSSPLPISSGWVDCEHGSLPLPAPAVCELLRDVPVEGCNLRHETVTPTGAAILKGLRADFGPCPTMIIKQIGNGSGSYQRPDNRPNTLRLLIGEQKIVQEHQSVEIIETNLDDWSPESFPYLSERILDKGALDVSLSQILMKKGRPGFRIQVIAPHERAQELKGVLLAETTAIGLRYRTEKRLTLPRHSGTIMTQWGALQVKMVEGTSGVSLYPEYEACRKMAISQNVPIREVYRLVNIASGDDFIPSQVEDKVAP